jgi:DNA-binding CsgD family transcriptional regulator
VYVRLARRPAPDPSAYGLVGRVAECRQLDALLTSVRNGCSRSLVVRGEAGIGKTALLDYAASMAAGMRVLRAHGTEFEAELAFSALHELVRPLLGFFDKLPEVQVEALRVAFALCGGPPVNRLAVYAATLNLLAAAAEQTPVLCLVDDAHWLDRASADALCFAARRMLAERIAIVFAARDRPPFEAPSVAELPLAGLDLASGSALACRAGMAPSAAAHLVAVSAGNPLALLELPSMLTEDQRQGRTALDEQLTMSDRVEAAFLAQARSLPETTWRALVVCAVIETGELAVVSRALRADGLPLAALDPAVAAGLVSSGNGFVHFRHPLVRSAVYSAAGPGTREAAHLAIAAVLTEPDDADRKAWHLAAAASAPDEPIAAALEAAADRARQRGGLVARARAFERAGRLSPDREQRARRLLQAATAWRDAGVSEPHAALVDEVLTLTRRPDTRGSARCEQAYLASQGGDTERLKAFVDEAERYAELDPVAAAQMMSMALNQCWARWDVAGMLRISARVAELITPTLPDPRWPKGAIRLACAQVLAGLPDGAELARACVPLCEQHPADGSSAELAEVLTWLDEYPTANRLLERDITASRRDNGLLLLAYALPRQAAVLARQGSLSTAYSAAAEALEVVTQIGPGPQQGRALAGLAAIEALMGADEDCRHHASMARDLTPDAFLDVDTRIRYAVGTCALAAGHPGEALNDLEYVQDALRRGGVVEPAVIPVAADLIETYLKLSRPNQSRELLDELETAAALTGRRSAEAAAARCRGLLADDDAFEAEMETAVALHATLGAPLEQARTLLCYGQRLRRVRRRRDARHQLNKALALFENAGAVSWARQCRAEIAATGQHPRPSHSPPVGRLTAQERQIALYAAEGLTNREIAIRLFLSPKTIDYHLGNIYRKLLVRSRHELIHRVLTAGQPTDLWGPQSG